MEITLALAQMDIVLGEPDENVATARTLVAQAANEGANLVLLPELWPTGYDLEHKDRYTTALDEGHFALMADLARAHQLFVAGTALEANPHGKPFNTAALYGPDGGQLGVYRKVHLWAPLGEVDHMTPGNTLPTFDLPWGRIALAICYDLRFPELYRSLGQPDLILVPAAFTATTGRAHWLTLLRARAIENLCYVLAPAQGGRHENGRATFGHSVLFDPWGETIAQIDHGPGVIVGDVDPGRIAQVRASLPALSHRVFA